MAGLKNYWILLLLLLLFLPLFIRFLPCNAIDAYKADFPSANISASWKNNPSNEKGSVQFFDGSTLRPILLVYNKSYPPFGLGFFSNTTSTSISSTTTSTANNFPFYLVVFMLTALRPADEFMIEDYYAPRVFWSANRDKPVRENATLDFTIDGDLVLKDADGSPVWSTSNTSGHSATRMEIIVGGNLMLLNASNGVVWQSFDYPTDTWLPNQKIYYGQRLTARNSSSNLSTGIYYLLMANDGVHAFLDSNPPKQYALLFGTSFNPTYPINVVGLGEFWEPLSSLVISFENFVDFSFNFTPSVFQYLVLEPNGHLILYRVDKASQFAFRVNTQRHNILKNLGFYDDCIYPTVCGHYGVCLDGGECDCPDSNYFRPFKSNVGCAQITPLSCKDGFGSHTFVKLDNNITYFDFVPMILNTTVDKCKDACLSNCSCKAAFFRYVDNVSSGNCSLQSDELYSFMPSKKEDSGFSSFAFIKVQQNVTHQKKHVSLVLVLASSFLGGLVIVTFVARIGYHYSKLKNTNGVDEEDDDDQVTEALTKFSFEELKSSTHNFQIKLGQGGFGSVFEGVLCDGTKVAVKCLESIGQGRKEFLAEVNTIGKVDHFNLVRLIGYCVDKSNRLLVYEHMCNGSLDRWIFNQDTDKRLDWKIRRRIIYGVAKGLEYLHEECSRNIIHFDIKPQNILLDGDFHAKISDFGLAKLIDRNQSVVLTALKGTPGYVAPELFGGSNISVKADVYSFGIVILETVCGRKNLDSSEAMPLINVVRAKAEGDQLYDLIDEFNEDIRCHKEETIKMIKIGIWCLQTHDKRPSMSMVVKALEGLTNMDIISDYQFLSMSHIDNLILVDPNISGPPEASILSGPR